MADKIPVIVTEQDWAEGLAKLVGGRCGVKQAQNCAVANAIQRALGKPFNGEECHLRTVVDALGRPIYNLSSELVSAVVLFDNALDSTNPADKRFPGEVHGFITPVVETPYRW